MSSENIQKEFSPVFIVGAPRSGTTLIAVLLDRHSKIAIPPETQFFSEFMPFVSNRKNSNRKNSNAKNSNEEKSNAKEMEIGRKYDLMIDRALAFRRISDLGLDRKQLKRNFSDCSPSFSGLFQAILKTYAESKGKSIPGEKSPGHIRHVKTLLSLYPKARIICVARDGRDVVLSLLKVPWAEPGNPRRFRLFCMEWADLARLVVHYEKTLPEDRFTIVRYEDMLNDPEKELSRLCSFAGVKFEAGQLQPQNSSTVVPGWEKKWKGNASQKLDTSRIEAWRNGADKSQLKVMNSMMGHMLNQMGYKDTSLMGCSAREKLELMIAKIPYLGPFRNISLVGLKVLRKFDFLKRKE